MGRSDTGLGLAVVWNVVQDHKGYINVMSFENGTTFELFFPITREEISGKDLAIPIEDLKGNGEQIQKLGAGQFVKKPLTLERIGLAVKEELAK